MSSQLLVRLPDDLAARFRRRVPSRERSAFVRRLLERALPMEEDDDPLYLAALEVEADARLAEEMAAWDAVAGDGQQGLREVLGLGRGPRSPKA